MGDKELSLQTILEKFPFSGSSNQLEKLTEFFITNFEGNQEYVRNQADISQPTIKKIKDCFEELEYEEKAVLVGHISDEIYGKALRTD